MIYILFLICIFLPLTRLQNLTNMLPGQRDHLQPFFSEKKINLPTIQKIDLIDSINLATEYAENQMQIIEPNIWTNGVVQTPDSPGWYYAAFSRTKIVAKNYSFTALIIENASKLLAKRYQLTKDEINYGLPTLDTRVSSLTCPMPTVSFPCYPGKYRSHNGNCNNVQSPQWGSSSMPFHRYLPAEYSDKISAPKSSIFYNNLENNNNEETIEIIRPLRKKTRSRSKRDINKSDKTLSQDTILVGNVFKDSENLFGEKQIFDSTYFDSSNWINDEPKRKIKKRFVEDDQTDRSFGLPNVRTVALALHTSNKKDQDNYGHLTTLMAFFTQFVFHDLAHVAQSVGHKGHRIKCCNIQENDKFSKHPECWPISIDKSDPIFSNLKQSCMEYVRSSPTIRVGCTLGPREQINQVTSFIDGSTIYGSSEEEAKSLRLFTDGLLKGQYINDNNNKKKKNISNQLLPAIETSQDCRSKNRTRCFKAGDIRVNENIGLTIMHTLWARKHNRIATELKKVNPEWTDEKLYQEARKIVGAQLQHIIYNELLPVILGEEAVNEFNLKPLKTGFYYGYDIDLNPSVSNALAVAVMPFIYTMLPEKLERYTETLQKTGVKKMSDTYFNPSELYNYEMFDEYILGLMNQNAKNPNLFYNNEMTNSISKQMKEALDLISVIIQQGRDHAIPSYTEWRKNCKLKPQSVNDFNDLQSIMTSSTIQKLSSVYSSVHDIDLFTGGLAEKPIRGAIVGPTFACLLRRQFYYLKRGDRYWYENDLPPNGFTHDQLTEIRKSTLADLLCENGNKISFVQPEMTLVSDPYLNAFQFCTNLKKIDLSKWASKEKDIDNQQIHLNKENINQAIRNAFEVLSNKKNTLNKHKIGVSLKSPQGKLHGFLRPTRQALNIAEKASLLELVSNNLLSSLMDSLQKDQENQSQIKSKLNKLIKLFPQQLDLLDYVERNSINTLSESSVSNLCKDDRFLPCDHTSPFRTASGFCNNLDNPDYGSSFRVFNRFLPPVYNDGISEPRKYSISGNDLPSGRIISTVIHQDISNLHSRYTLITMQWGQFIDHDLTFTPQSMGPNNSLLDCKSCDSHTTVNKECWPILIPENDPFYPSNSTHPNCLHFVRSLPGQKKLGHRNQLNQVTAFVDGSQIYGSDSCDAAKLRLFKEGQLNYTVQQHNQKPLLPITPSNIECRAPSKICFEAGDLRSSEQPSLACMHTIWMRQHNRIVKELSSLNPHWNDEQLYQHGRKIVSAQVQMITYNEFIPRILGFEYANKYDLAILKDGYYEKYDKKCDPTINNEIASAVFRFGHSLLRPSFLRLNRNFQAAEEPLKLRSSFFNSDMLFGPNAIDNLLRGLISTNVETLDSAITEEVKNHLFEDKKIPFSGMDLISLNIQRARDHALPPYNYYREKCNLTKAKTFEDLSDEMPAENIERLKQVYENVDDIDLFSGGMSETSLHGGSVGPTFGCILVDQFQRLKRCDRFWFETSDPFTRFSDKQLNEIRKTSLAEVVCKNSDSISMIQRNAMDTVNSFTNPRVPCKSLPSLDLVHWRERGSYCSINNKVISLEKSEHISPCISCTCTKEGPICSSIRIKNCFASFKQFTMKDILEDSVCKVQCSFSYRLQNSINKSPNNLF